MTLAHIKLNYENVFKLLKSIRQNARETLCIAGGYMPYKDAQPLSTTTSIGRVDHTFSFKVTRSKVKYEVKISTYILHVTHILIKKKKNKKKFKKKIGQTLRSNGSRSRGQISKFQYTMLFALLTTIYLHNNNIF